jgi:hypothetical protein
MSGAISLLPLYAYMAWRGKILPFILEALIVGSTTCTEDTSWTNRESSFSASQKEELYLP